MERSEGGADYRDAFDGSNRQGASFEADVPMTLAALLDHMEQRSIEVLSGCTDHKCALPHASALAPSMQPSHADVIPYSTCQPAS